LESGQFGEDEKKQTLNEVEQTGKILNNAVWGRKRAVGGTTIAWGGQSLPFTSIDFEKRDWVQNSGWPLSYDEMIKYYAEANAFMGIDNMNYTTDILPNILPKDPGINPSIFDLHVSKWAAQPNFFLLYKDELEKNVTVIYNAQVTTIQKKEEAIEYITISNFNDIIFKVDIKKLVITAGTIETVRILLNNNLGDHSGWLGKNFMDHPCIEAGTIEVKNAYRIQRYFNTHLFKSRKYSIRLSLNRKFQEKKKLLNCSAAIMFRLPEDAFDPYVELKSFRKDFKLSRLFKLSGSIVNIFKGATAYVFNRFYYKANAATILALMIEQEPINKSYISLSDKKDKFGISNALINWEITSKTWDTAIATANAVRNEIETLNFGKVNLYDHLNAANPDWSNYLSDVCHQMGGCKMSLLSHDGVVNENLQVWGINNLYVCSCAVFPTASHSNPTLTMLALASRLANHLD
jgi:choline dehydrogenase-like flavoprotein